MKQLTFVAGPSMQPIGTEIALFGGLTAGLSEHCIELTFHRANIPYDFGVALQCFSEMPMSNPEASQSQGETWRAGKARPASAPFSYPELEFLSEAIATSDARQKQLIDQS